MLFTVFSLLELFFSCYIVVAVAKKNLLKMPAIISSANFQLIQMLRHPRLAFDWLSVSFFEFRPIRMSGLLVLCTELTLFCIELAENCIYLNQSVIFSCILLSLKRVFLYTFELISSFVADQHLKFHFVISVTLHNLIKWTKISHCL